MAKPKSSIAQARYASGYTQSELAKKLGVTPPTVSGWENDPSSMRLGAFFDLYRLVAPRGKAILDQFVDESCKIF